MNHKTPLSLFVLCLSLVTGGFAANSEQNPTDDCLTPIVVDNPDITKLDASFSTDYPPLGHIIPRRVVYDFVPSIDDSGDWITPKETIINEVTEPISWIKGQITNEILKNATCNASLSVSPFDILPQPNGTLYAKVSIPTTIRACVIFDWICSKGLKFYHCQQRIIAAVDHTTFELDVNDYSIAGKRRANS